MQSLTFMDKFPINSLKIEKKESSFKDTDAIILHLKTLIDSHKIATFIALFDHFSHTKNLNGTIEEGIINAKNIIFCFGAAIPSSHILAVRPRSFGIVEYQDAFTIEFMDAPKKELTQVMQEWAQSIKNL